MTGDVTDLAAKRRAGRKAKPHKATPRVGVELRRYEILTGYWGVGEPPMRHHYPMLALLGCVVCRKTIRCQSPEAEWEHVEWT